MKGLLPAIIPNSEEEQALEENGSLFLLVKEEFGSMDGLFNVVEGELKRLWKKVFRPAAGSYLSGDGAIWKER